MLYGVYDLLEDDLGCRWYAPDTPFVPKRKTIEVSNSSRTVKPVFEYRDPKMYAGHSYSIWWRKHFVPEYVARTRNSGMFINQSVHQIDPRHGGYFNVLHFGHNLSRLIPAKQYAKDHPDYFALHNGKRVTQGDLELCMTHPDVVRIAADTMRKWMRENPDAEMFFIGQSDTGKYCKCDRCMGAYEKYGPVNKHGKTIGLGYGGLAGRNLHFANQVAQLLEEEFPDNRIGIFSYASTRNPPRHIKAHRNIVVWYCPLERCACHALNSGPINKGFYDWPDGIKRWQQVVGQMYLYDYWLSNALGPPADLLTLGKTIRFAERVNMRGCMIDSIKDIQAGFGFYRYWLYMQLMRNPKADADWLLRQFLDAYYGKAAVYIDQFIRLAGNQRMYEPLPLKMANIWTNEKSPTRRQLVHGCHLGHRKLKPEAIERGYELFQKALGATADDAKARSHVQAARMVLQFAMLDRLPGNDPRLPQEAASLLEMARKLEMPTLQGIRLKTYREQLNKKIGKVPYSPLGMMMLNGRHQPVGRITAIDYRTWTLNCDGMPPLTLKDYPFADGDATPHNATVIAAKGDKVAIPNLSIYSQ